MAEYINREALSEYFREKFEYYKAESEIKVCGGYMYDGKMQYAAIVAKHFLDELKRTPSADVVEVVRCKDCKYYDGFDCFRLDLQLPDPDNFCSWAERRSDNG